MPKYQCPECEAVLKRETPVAEGKKIKCPKCESIFKPVPMREAGAEPAPVKKMPKPVAKPAAVVDEDDEYKIGGSYGVAAEKEDTAEEKKKKDVNYGSLRDKYAKSTRGPAMVRVVKLTNGLLMVGLVVALGGMATVIVGLWPFVFTQEMPRGSEARTQILKIVAGVISFIYGGCICYGGSKMHDLGSYGWAMAAAVMTTIAGAAGIISGLVWLFNITRTEGEEGPNFILIIVDLAVLGAVTYATVVGSKTIARLREESVRDGFEETLTARDY